MTLTQQAIEAFKKRIDELSDRQLATIVTSALNDRELLLDIRQARLAEVAAIEKKLIANGWMNGPTTAECRRMAKGKV